MADNPVSSVAQPHSAEPAGPGPPEAPFRGAAAWKPWTVGVALIVTVGLALAGRAIVATHSEGSERSLLVIGIALILLNLAPIGLVLLLANRQGRPTASDFGLRRPPLGRSIGLVIAGWIAFNVLTVLWVVALGLDVEEGPLTERLGTEGTLTVLVLFAVLAVATPLGEEFLFRGYIFRALRNWRGVWPAAIATGILFAATHVGWLPIALFVPVVVFGIGMCFVYHWTGSLYPCIALHALNNSIATGFALDWSWLIPLLVVCSILAALTIAWLIALLLGDGPLRSGESAESCGGSRPEKRVKRATTTRMHERATVVHAP